MPELPEVETIRRDLVKAVTLEKISVIKLLSPKTAKHDAAFFIDFLKSRKIKGVYRRGKLLIFELSKKKTEKESHFLIIHLKMTGQLIYVGKKKKIIGGHSLNENNLSDVLELTLPNKHTRAQFIFSNGDTLYFNDMRRFGYLQIVSGTELERIKRVNYGPEPLTDDFSLDYLTNAFKNRTANIKSILLNQKIIAGLGNIYVDEALFLAGVRPGRMANDIKKKELIKLYFAINEIIEKAIVNRGTTFNNYVDSSGRKGNFSNMLQVYGRGKLPCFVCKEPIMKIKLAGRGTHYCPKCQK